MQEIWVWSLGWKDPLEKEMQPTPVFLPGKSHGQRSPLYPWGHKELDTTERLNWLAESNGNWLLKLEIIPQSVFEVFLSPQKTLYTKGLRELLLSQQKPPSERDLKKQGKKNEKLLCIMSDFCNYSPPGSSVHQILQARILEWVAFPLPGNLPNPGIKPGFPALQAGSLPSDPYYASDKFNRFKTHGQKWVSGPNPSTL